MAEMNDKTAGRPLMPASVAKPVLIGLTAFILLFQLINRGAISDPQIHRYLAGHPVSKVTTAMFLVGFASLALIALDILRQRSRLQSLLPTKPSEDASQENADRPASTSGDPGSLNAALAECSDRDQATWLWRRVSVGCEYVRRNGAHDGLDNELKYAAEVDNEERNDRYSFVRIMIWAIPMLGFLGTVLGISEALGGLDLGGEGDFQGMMGKLRGSLYVAFDTTALALTFAILLMFFQFATDRMENGLMAGVEARSREILSRWWDINNQSRDQYVQAVETMGSRVLKSSEDLVQLQTSLWRKSIQAAESAWVESVQAARETVQASLCDAVVKSTESLGENLQSAIEQSDEAVSRRWEQWQLALGENAKLLQGHQKQMIEQTVMIQKVMERLGELARTRDDLRQFLATQPSGVDFSEAAKSLSTAIRLLEFRFREMEDTEEKPDTIPLSRARQGMAA
jgi:biopolymer transport protein ExbB/TolQ